MEFSSIPTPSRLLLLCMKCGSYRQTVKAAAACLGLLAEVSLAQAIDFKKIDKTLDRYGFVLTSSLWRQRIIPVCFENSKTFGTDQLLLVETAVEKSWQQAAGIQFTGWNQCTPSARGIRILISDDQTPPVSLYGRSLDGIPNGMRLNFTFKNWGKFCAGQEKKCIASISVHEFGHAIGFLHESLREDAPADCKSRKNVIADGRPAGMAETKTTYDADSVMNYCNLIYNNNAILSSGDRQAALLMYPRF